MNAGEASGGGTTSSDADPSATVQGGRKGGPDLSQLRPQAAIARLGQLRPAEPDSEKSSTPPGNDPSQTEPGPLPIRSENSDIAATPPRGSEVVAATTPIRADLADENPLSDDPETQTRSTTVGPGRVRNPKIGPDNKVRVPLTMPGSVVRQFREEARLRALSQAELLLEAFDHHHHLLDDWFPPPPARTSALPARRMGIRRGLAEPTTIDVRVYEAEYAVFDHASRAHNWVSLSEMLTRVVEEELGLQPTPHRQPS